MKEKKDEQENTGNAAQEQQTRYLSQSIRLKEASSPDIVRHTMAAISLSIVSFIVWAGCVHVHEIARTPGEVVPSGYQQTVQHLEGGIISAIYVREGQWVAKGTPLLRFSGDDVRRDLDRANIKQILLTLQTEKLRAFIDNRPPDFKDKATAHPELLRNCRDSYTRMVEAKDKDRSVIQDQISEKEQEINILSAELQTMRGNFAVTSDLLGRLTALNKKKLVADIKLLQSQQQYNQQKGGIAQLKSQIVQARSALQEYQSRLTSLIDQQINDAQQQLDTILAEKMQNKDLIDKLRDRKMRLVARAPVDGFVKGLAVNTIGSVIQPGQLLMEIVPTGEKLVVSLKIPPQYIGHIHIGQPVQVKFSAYDFSRYGSVPGHIEAISPTTFDGSGGMRFYQGNVTLDHPYVGGNPKNKILPGMTVMADIITGNKTILQYLLKPIQKATSTAFTER